MLVASDFQENSGGGAGGAASNGVAEELRTDGSRGGGGEERDRNSAGNRWPHEETLALLKIRSEMDHAFRDSTLKSPLWDEISRKLEELGYHRSAKKCKEKFENIYKYHKRSRSGRQNGKNYRFFEQLEVFDNQFPLPSTPLNQIQASEMETTTKAPEPGLQPPILVKPISAFQDFMIPSSTRYPNTELLSTSTSTASSSESEGSIKKKRKLIDYFERLMRDVLEKQEDIQNKLLEAIEKCEKDRMAREEAWKVQEMARIKREQEFLAHERAMSTAKDAAVLAFLQKISPEALPVQMLEIPIPVPEKRPDKQGIVSEKYIDRRDNGLGDKSMVDVDKPETGSAGEHASDGSSSRWPKAEIEALVMLRTDLDLKYKDNTPKGPLWEEISAAMKKFGYDRSAKRCKEKWENINKYYKRVKESNKTRPKDSKTCPYFDMLESRYEKMSKKSENSLKPENILMQMTGAQQPQQHHSFHEGENEKRNENQDEVAEDEDEDYQVMANNPSSVRTMD